MQSGRDYSVCVNEFWDCTSLVSITLSSNLKYINECAFENCLSLRIINFK